MADGGLRAAGAEDKAHFMPSPHPATNNGAASVLVSRPVSVRQTPKGHRDHPRAEEKEKRRCMAPPPPPQARNWQTLASSLAPRLRPCEPIPERPGLSILEAHRRAMHTLVSLGYNPPGGLSTTSCQRAFRKGQVWTGGERILPAPHTLCVCGSDLQGHPKAREGKAWGQRPMHTAPCPRVTCCGRPMTWERGRASNELSVALRGTALGTEDRSADAC